MERHKDFPLREFRDELEKLQSSLKEAEASAGKNAELVDSIKAAKDFVGEVTKKTKTVQ